MDEEPREIKVSLDGLKVTRDQLEGLGPALRQVGVYLETQAQAAFRRQGRGEAWAPRMVPNVPGIVADLNKGGQPKARRFRSRPALVDTGRLRASVRSQVRGRSVIVGSNLPYARTQQQGGETRHTLTDAGRKGLASFLRRRKDLREDLGWLFAQPSFTVAVRARPFVTVEDEDVPVIERILAEHFAGVGGRG